ncbi:MAG TPA: hypothetical protein VHZ99_08060 [Steroidobacteraceae bacterium]|nr:hypothetical protein [Steroidobacteraceae bacterium]
MTNGLKIAAAVASFGMLAIGAGAMAAEPQQQPSKSIVKQLKAAQDALQQKHYDEALNDIGQAKSASGEKTAYDNYVINVLQIQAYQGKNDSTDLVQALGSAAQSQYASAEQQKTWYKFIAQYYFQQKDYNKSIDAAQEAIKHGANDADTQQLVAKAQYLAGKYKDAAQSMNEIVNRMEKPDEDSLRMQWQFDLKAEDKSGADKTVERLVALYPKPEYWAQALASLVRMDIKDSHLQLNVYRLMNDVGVLKLPTDYAEMAELALDQGYPGETVSVLQEAFQKNVFTEQRDKDRYQHLMDGAKQRAAQDQQSLGKTEPTDGNGLLQLGVAYLTYGQADKAVSYITKGIQKGGLKSPEDANVELGIAQLRAHNTAEAQKAFDKVASSQNPGYARLGKLWALRASSHG